MQFSGFQLVWVLPRPQLSSSLQRLLTEARWLHLSYVIDTTSFYVYMSRHGVTKRFLSADPPGHTCLDNKPHPGLWKIRVVSEDAFIFKLSKSQRRLVHSTLIFRHIIDSRPPSVFQAFTSQHSAGFFRPARAKRFPIDRRRPQKEASVRCQSPSLLRLRVVCTAPAAGWTTRRDRFLAATLTQTCVWRTVGWCVVWDQISGRRTTTPFHLFRKCWLWE